MKDLPLVISAFVDTSRDKWTTTYKLPAYLDRDADTYLRRFSMLARLRNHKHIYVDEQTHDRAHEILRRSGTSFELEIIKRSEYQASLVHISNIMSSESYQVRLGKRVTLEPECRVPEYVLATNLKGDLLCNSLSSHKRWAKSASWIDFGFFKDPRYLPRHNTWSPRFPENKIMLLQLQDPYSRDCFDTIISGEVVFAGALIHLPIVHCSAFHEAWINSKRQLLKENLVDDDQGLLLLSFLQRPDMFRPLHISNWQKKGRFRKLLSPFDRYNVFNAVKRFSRP